MPETQIQEPQTSAPEAKVVSAGKPERVEFTIPKNTADIQSDQPANNPISITNEGANATTIATNGTVAEAVPAPTLTDEQLAAYFEAQGIKYEGIDKLKEKINYVAPKEPSEEEKTKQLQAKEKRLVDKWVEGGGTVENYVAIKGIADADLNELSVSTLKKELKDAGFKEDEIDNIIKERYYQISDDDLEQVEEETDREFAKRKKEYGAKKLANRSSHTKQQAQNILAELNKAVESEDLQVQEEITHSSKVDEHFKAMPRKVTLEIGEINGTTIPPIEYEISESDLAESQTELKDPVKFKQFLFNQDGSYNYTNLSNVLTRNKYLESAAKVSFLTGMTKGINDALKNFSSTPQELGVGGSPDKNGQKGKVASAGTVQRVRP